MISCPALVVLRELFFFLHLGGAEGGEVAGLKEKKKGRRGGAEGVKDKECGCLARADVCCLEWTFLCVPPGEDTVHRDYILCPYILYV